MEHPLPGASRAKHGLVLAAKCILFLALIASFPICGTGQPIFGLRASYGLSDIPKGLDPQYRNPLDRDDLQGSVINAGIMLGGPVRRKISPRTEFTLKIWRQQYESVDNGRTGAVDAMVVGLQVPLLIEARIKRGIRLAVGPGIELRTSAKSEVVFEPTVGTNTIPLNTDMGDDLRALGTVFIFEAGYVLKNGFGFSVRSDSGRTDLFKKDSPRSRLSISDVAFCLEFDINALKRKKTASP